MAPLVASLLLSVRAVPAQSATRDALAQKVQELSDAMTRTQALLERSQHELEEMRLQLSDLERQIALGGPVTAIPEAPVRPLALPRSRRRIRLIPTTQPFRIFASARRFRNRRSPRRSKPRWKACRSIQ